MKGQETPRGNRVHIGIFGRRNAGKSSLVNALTNQEAALVSAVAGTTTDPVYQAMELHGAGPVVFIDTAGFDDTGALGGLRVERTRTAAARADIALVLFGEDDTAEDAEAFAWARRMEAAGAFVLPVISKADLYADGGAALAAAVGRRLSRQPLVVSATTGEGIDALRAAIAGAMPKGEARLLAGLAAPGDTVMLVMPQDAEAPKGRLILPQVQTIRELLDTECAALCCTPASMARALAALKEPPALIVTDSNVFAEVHAMTPKESRLTSFSVLFAAHKGDLAYFRASAEAVDSLPKNARVLIAEACTHNAIDGDIGREKIPALLRKRLGDGITVRVASGADFPDDPSGYDLIVHCGACMFNRRYVLSRVAAARQAGVPMTNYGVLIAKLKGISDKLVWPGEEGARKP